MEWHCKGPMFTDIQYQILKTIWPGATDSCCSDTYKGKSKLTVLMGDDFLTRVVSKVVIDFGCGNGVEAVEMARSGARHVIGVDIREDLLQAARKLAATVGVQERCAFGFSTSEPADIIVSLDAFEHFGDPAEILRVMDKLLRPGGEVLVSFGPTWYHPSGGHLFSIFPWAHLVFSEQALIRWRATFKTDGATRFSQVAGGLNQMTISKFETLVENSPFKVADLELVPIRRLRHFHNVLTREFTTAIVRCRLVRRT